MSINAGCFTLELVIFNAEIFAAEAKFYNFKELKFKWLQFLKLCMFKLSKMSFEITFIVCGCCVYKDIWKVEISLEELPFYLSQITVKIVMLLWSFTCFKAASTASLATSAVPEGSAFDNGPSDFKTF